LAAGGLFEQSEYDHVYKYFRTKKIIKWAIHTEKTETVKHIKRV
jgi:hypothetical protein